MCGIFAAVGDMFKKQDAFMADMFVMDSLRGLDSCGVLSVTNYNSQVSYFKRAMLPLDFLDSKGYDKIIRGKNAVMVGHNRWASKGSINHYNAHPFNTGSITGVHNGTLTQQHKLPDHAEFEVDSENIIHAINKEGIEKTWGKLVGAAALMWWDSSEQTFNFIRNKERPLWFCYSRDLKQMYAASEKYMLMAALYRNGIAHFDLEELPVNTLYSFRVNTSAKNDKDIVKCSTQFIQPYVAPVTYLPVKKAKKPAVDSGYKGLGETVDFIVDAVNYYTNFTEYNVIDNNTGLGYVIQSYAVNTILEVDDLATGKVHRVTGLAVYINSASVKMDSEFSFDADVADAEQQSKDAEEEVKSSQESLESFNNWIDEMFEENEEENLEELEHEFVDALYKEKQLREAYDGLQDHDCNLCGSPVEREEEFLLTTAGQLFCDVCKTDQMVQDYVVEGEV